MHILLFILILIVAIIVFGLSILGFLLRTIFGIGRNSSSTRPEQRGSDDTTGQSRQDYNRQPHNSNDDEEEILSEDISGRRRNKKKIFTKDEGEYVDFEEIKDE